MKEEQTVTNTEVPSVLKVDLVLREHWLNAMLEEQKLVIPVNEQYSLKNISVELADGKVSLKAEIMEKPDSYIVLDCQPIWNTYEQRFYIKEIEIKTDSKNLLVKSAGWIANTFMGAKLDEKIEAAVNKMFELKKEQLIKNGFPIPLPDGKGQAAVESLFIEDMKFHTNRIAAKVSVGGQLYIHLGSEDLFVTG